MGSRGRWLRHRPTTMCLLPRPSIEAESCEDEQCAKQDAPKASALLQYLQATEVSQIPGVPTTLSPCGQKAFFQSAQPAWFQEGMPAALAAALRDSHSLYDFLKNPVPEDLGLVQFRLLGDHTDDHLWLAFDYLAADQEPSQDQSVLSCVRVRRRPLMERRRRYELRGTC